MADYDMIVIGEGTAALNFLYGALHGDKKKFGDILNKNVLVISEQDLWLNVPDSELEMGQPFEFLYSLPYWDTWQQVGTYAPSKQKGSRSYARVGEYAAQEQGMKLALQFTMWGIDHKITFEVGIVTEVKKPSAQRYEVTYENDLNNEVGHTASQIVIASGLNGARPTTASNALQNLTSIWDPGSRPNIKYSLLNTGTQYITAKDSPPASSAPDFEYVVAVEGAAPVASWAVATAIANGATKVIWLSRYPDNPFRNANAWGRNAAIIAHAAERGWMRVGQLVEAQQVVPDPSAKNAPTALLKIEPIDATLEYDRKIAEAKELRKQADEASRDQDKERLRRDAARAEYEAAEILGKLTKLPLTTEDGFESTLRAAPYFQTTYELVHQYINAGGQRPGLPTFLAADIFSPDPSPVRDDGPVPRLSSYPTPPDERVVIALTDKLADGYKHSDLENSLTIIGAAVFGYLLESRDNPDRISAQKILRIFPKIAQVDRGIAVTRAAIKVLTGFIESPEDDPSNAYIENQFNWNSTDIVETEKFLEKLLGSKIQDSGTYRRLAEILVFGDPRVHFPARMDHTFGRTYEEMFGSDPPDPQLPASLVEWLGALATL